MNSTDITLTQYLGKYADHPDAKAAVREAAVDMLAKVNELYALAKEHGLDMPDNPVTKSGVSGSANGGFRPQVCPIGAPKSTHKTGHAVDRYDPHRKFASWCLEHLDELVGRGLYMEDPRWTPTWVHLQDVPPGSKRTVYIPSTAPALAPALPEQMA